MSDPFSLAGRTALVTGANTGLGQAIALGLARAGAEVVCAARSPLDETLELIAAARRRGAAVRPGARRPGRRGGNASPTRGRSTSW